MATPATVQKNTPNKSSSELKKDLARLRALDAGLLLEDIKFSKAKIAPRARADSG